MYSRYHLDIIGVLGTVLALSLPVWFPWSPCLSFLDVAKRTQILNAIFVFGEFGREIREYECNGVADKFPSFILASINRC
jgi:hypothetical protein